jgi:hypothetical protein
MDSIDTRSVSEVRLSQWLNSPEVVVDVEVQGALRDLVRRSVGEFLQSQGLWSPIEPHVVAEDLIARWGVGITNGKLAALRAAFEEATSSALTEEDPKEVTRWLWIWGQSWERGELEIEEGFFRAIDYELRRLINRVLRMQKFAGVRHKLDQGDLVSELYLKLARSNIPRLPENSAQFYGFVDVAVQRIVLDMLKAAARRPKTEHPAFFDHPDPRTGQNQLQVLLNAESLDDLILKRQRLEELVNTLPEKASGLCQSPSVNSVGVPVVGFKIAVT